MASTDDKLIAALNLDLVTFNKLLEQGVSATKILKTSLADLSKIRMGSELKDWEAIQQKNNKGLKTGSDYLREYYREQRVQDRTVREASQAVVGFTVGLASLVSQGNQSNETVKRFTSSLLLGATAAQGAEFSVAALGIAGRNLTGSLGKVAASLSANAGLIGALIGVGAGLVSFFSNVNEEAKKAAEGGLKSFGDRIQKMTIKDKESVLNNLKQEGKDIQTAIDNNLKTLVGRNGVTATIAKDNGLDEELQRRKIQNELLLKETEDQIKADKALAEIRKQSDKALKGQVSPEDLKQKYEIQKTANIAAVNFAKELQLLQLQNDEQLVQSRAKTEAEKLDVTKAFAIERIKIEQDAQLKILQLEKQAILNQLNLLAGQTQDDSVKREILKLNAQLTLNGQAVKNVNSTAASKLTGIDATAASGKENILSGTKEFAGNEFGGAVRLAKTRQINDALISEQKKLATIEGQLLIEKDAARAEQLEKERQTTIDRIDLMQKEVSAREQMTAQLIQSGFDSYDASKTITENMATIARAQIKQALSVAVADALKSVFVSVPFPLNLILAPIAGAAASALFESVVPKFAKGGKLDGPSLRMAGEAGPEFYAPEKDFYDVAREEIIPQILSMAKRDLVRSNTVINNNSVNGGSRDMTPLIVEVQKLRSEFGNILSAIKEIPGDQLVLHNPIDFEDALKKKYPVVRRNYNEKYPDSK